MSYAESRKARQERDVNVGRHDFSWEESECPTLHSGFMEPAKEGGDKSALFLSIWFSNGSYRIRLQDRSSDEKSFADIGTLDQCFQKVEESLNNGSLDWSPDHHTRTGRNGA